MKSFMKKKGPIRLLACGLLLMSKGVWATCAFMDSRFGPNDSVALDFGKVIVQRDTPLGGVVATINNSALGGRNNFIQCDAPGFRSQWAAGGGFTPVVYNGETLYQSGVPGLALRVVTAGAGSTAGRYGTGPLPRQITGVACTSSAPAAWYRLCGGTWGNLRVQMVKIAAITGSGPLTSGSVVNALVVGETSIINYTIGSVQTVACSVTNRNITVNMGKAKNTDFTGVGSTSGDADFNINLNCDASTNVNLTVQAGSAGAADATKGVLNIDKIGTGQTATGVGVQVLFNNAPLALSKMLKIATTTSDGAYAIPLHARYYQTLPRVTPGKADANATFTMTYQ